MYDTIAPIPDKSGLPFPQIREQIPGHEATMVVLSRFLFALSRRSLREVIEHVEFAIGSGFEGGVVKFRGE